jgi:hypothetical protein
MPEINQAFIISRKRSDAQLSVQLCRDSRSTTSCPHRSALDYTPSGSQLHVYLLTTQLYIGKLPEFLQIRHSNYPRLELRTVY